jgi:hypothetical protein
VRLLNRSIALCLAWFMALSPAVYADTLIAASAERADVAVAMALAVAGDTVQVPGSVGTVNYASKLNVTAGVHLQGAGSGQTIIYNTQSASQGLESPIFDVLMGDGLLTELSGFTLRDSGGNTDSDGFWIGGNINGVFKVHDVVVEDFSFGMKHFNGFGVIYDSGFVDNDVSARIQGKNSTTAFSSFSGGNPPWGWNSTNYVVIEDSYILHTAWNDGDTYLIDTEFPANYILRFSNITNASSVSGVGIDGMDMHGETISSTLGLGILVYGNRFVKSGSSAVDIKLADIRGGSYSLIYSNTVVGEDAYITFRDDPTAGSLLSNTYAWANTDASGDFGTATGNGVTLNTHFFLSQPGGFTQLTYPHPLRGGATAPVIFSHPASQTISSGATATMSVSASGTAPLTYQWYQGTSGSVGSPIGGATSSSYTTPALSTTTQYWVRVSNSQGSADSNTATITVTSEGGTSGGGAGQTLRANSARVGRIHKP